MGKINVKLSREAIPIKKKNQQHVYFLSMCDWLHIEAVVRYSVPGGSLPVTDTAYTPGLKLPTGESKHVMTPKMGCDF